MSVIYKFDDWDEFRDHWDVIHSGILFWKKMRQMAEGKIHIYVDPNEEAHCSVEYCNNEMRKAALKLKELELAYHGEDYSFSGIIDWCLRQNCGEYLDD